MSKSVTVLVKDAERQYEGLRCSLGLLLEQHVVSMFVLGHEVEDSEGYKDNATFIDEMGGARFSDVPANVEKHGFRPIADGELDRTLTNSDLIIPF
jgi:hypothetical protein